MTEKDLVLDVENLAVSFRAYGGIVEAVRGVSFNLLRGETVAIVGESGSGKSVCVKSIMGILPGNAMVKSGKIRYGDLDLLTISEEQYSAIRGEQIGLIFQDPLSALNPIMKIGKQITEVLRKRLRMSRAAAKRRALEIMDAVGIPEPQKRFDAYPFQFSGGMRQRIVIAIALASNPKVLICDEPTTALDVTIQARILDLINNIKRTLNLSIIFITHDMGVVAKMADRINVMYAGKIVESGTANEIFFEPVHPYTWALLSSIPNQDSRERLSAIPGVPPNVIRSIRGDAFAPRNPHALRVDFKQAPPCFQITQTHSASTWLLHPYAPEVQMPEVLRSRIERMQKEARLNGN